MIGVVLGAVIGLLPGYEAEIFESGTVLLRDAWPDGVGRPPAEVIVIARTSCAEQWLEDDDPRQPAESRWTWRDRELDAFSMSRDGRALQVLASDDDGTWERPCELAEIWSCYVPHLIDWRMVALPDVGGFDPGATAVRDVLAALHIWSGPRACTPARITRSRRGLEVRTR